jgi:hypothetical protein
MTAAVHHDSNVVESGEESVGDTPGSKTSLSTGSGADICCYASVCRRHGRQSSYLLEKEAIELNGNESCKMTCPNLDNTSFRLL